MVINHRVLSYNVLRLPYVVVCGCCLAKSSEKTSCNDLSMDCSCHQELGDDIVQCTTTFPPQLKHETSNAS